MASELNLGRVKGTDGAPGTPGKDGKSAYQAAVEKGYTGTEEEFNAALAGMQDGPFLPQKGGEIDGVLYLKELRGANDVPCDVSDINITSSLTTDGGIHIDLGGCRVQGISTPTAEKDAANKGYVDGKILYGTADPGVGSALATGTLYVVYE